MLSPSHCHSIGLYVITQAEELRGETANEGKHRENKGWMKRCTMVGRPRRAILRQKCKRGPEENHRGVGADASERGREERREHDD